MQSFAKIKPLQNGKNSLSFTDVGKSYRSRELFTWQICLLKVLAKIKFSRKFPNLQFFYVYDNESSSFCDFGLS